MERGPFPLGRQARIAVLASGRGSNLEALADAFGPEDELGRIALVISEKADSEALARARRRRLDARYVQWTDRAAFEQEVLGFLRAAEIDLICLAGFMRLLSAEFVTEFAGRLLNVHPSLLPSFPGLRAHRQALQAEVVESGCTVHLVDEGIDTGPIILQRRVPILPGDDEERLSARILEQEHEAYPLAVRLLLSGQVPIVSADTR